MTSISRFTSTSLRLLIILALGAGMALGNVQPTKAQGVTINVPADYLTIQAAIDAASEGDTINVFPGTYNEGNASRDIYTGAPGGPASGLLVYKNGLTIQGVDASGIPITNRAAVVATIIATQRDVSLGDTIITGDNVTISGVKFKLADLPVSCNKNVFATGENFTLKNSIVDNITTGCSGLYLSDERGGMHVNSFTIQNNQFLFGELTVINGVGQTGPASGRQITGNLFQHITDWGGISLTGITGSGWTTQPIGDVTISGNSFVDNAYQIIARGSNYADPADYWTGFFASNTFDKAVLTLTPGGDARPDAYERLGWVNDLTDPAKNPNFRMIGTNIQEGIDRADAGDTVKVAAGTYNEVVTLGLAGLTLQGVGDNAINGTIINVPGTGTGVTVSADNVTLKDLRIEKGDGVGMDDGRGLTFGGTLINDFTLNGVTITGATDGLRVGSGTTIDGLHISNSHFDGNWAGWYLSHETAVGTTVTNVDVTNSTFNNNLDKGLYAEKLSNALFDEVTVSNSGTDPAYAWNAGIDINLKWGAFQNIEFRNTTITDSGLMGSATNPLGPTGITIKARSDGGYASPAATLTGVTLTNVTVTGGVNGVRFGEPGKNNAGPTNVTVTHSSFTGSSNLALVNASLAPVDAIGNWWGSASPVWVSTISGNVSYAPWCINAACATFSVLPVHNLTTDVYYPTIQAAIDAATAGDTIDIAAGTYTENVIVSKSVTLAGAGAGTIIQPAISNPNCGGAGGGSICAGGSNVVLVQANNVIIHDLTLDGDNPALTSTNNVGGANLDARNGIITNHAAGVYNDLEVYNVTVKNIYLRGIYASSGGTFNFHNNTVTNVQAEYASIAMFAWYGPGTMANNTVSYANDAISANHSNGIQFLNNTVTHSGSGVHTDNAGDGGGVADLIQGNNVDCTDTSGENYGVWVFVPYIAPTFNNNTVTNCEIGISAWGTGAAVTTQFTNNTVTGNKAVAGVGAYITTDMAYYGYSDVNVNFSGNVITNYETGVYLDANQQSWEPGPYVAKTITAAFHLNQIYGNTTGAEKNTTGTYIANFEKNWWGAASGPSGVGLGTGDSIGSGIDFSPWCGEPACTSFFANTPPALPSSFYGEIHFSDGAPSAGDTIQAYVPGISTPVGTTTVRTENSILVYTMDVRGDATDTPAKEGGAEGDAITFKINGRIVATSLWHSGTIVELNFHPPQALPGAAYSGNEGTPIEFTGSANDWGNDATTYQWDMDNNTTYETTGQNPTHTFAQDGTFTVGLKVTDAQGGEGTRTVLVTVSNVAPTVNAGADFTVAEDVTFNFAGTASDIAADLPLTYAWDFDYDGSTFDVDASGSLTPSHTYAVVGDHTAALRVTDDDVSVIDTVVVTVSNVNDAPVIEGQNPISTNEDTSREIVFGDLLVTDPDNTYPAGFSLTVLPGTNYTLVGNTLTPALNFNGELTVLVYINDGGLQSNTFDLTITVNAVNDAPVADAQSVITAEDTPLAITLTGSDIESSPLTYEVTDNPLHGTLSGIAPNLTYTPALNYNGTDSFKFRVNDGDLNSVEATINITVSAVNDEPVITGQVVLSTNEDTALTITLADLTVEDVDNTYPTGFSLTVQSGTGYTVVGNTITPTHNFHGPLTVPVIVNDGFADSNAFNLTVTVVDVLPTAVSAGGPYTAIAGQAVTLNGSAICAAVDTCTYAWDLDGDLQYDDAAILSPLYTWNTVGDYTVSLRVADDDSNLVTASADVHILPATHSLTLVPGWNLVSFNVKPTSTAIATVLASLNGNYDLVYGWDASVASNNWMKYSPTAPGYSNTLSNLDETMGFWIHMTAADTLDVVGSIPSTTDISLSDNAGGWNLVAYPSAENRQLPYALSGVGFSLVYAYHANDATDPWKLFSSSTAPVWANDLTELAPGWGYWVKVSADDTWSVQYLGN